MPPSQRCERFEQLPLQEQTSGKLPETVGNHLLLFPGASKQTVGTSQAGSSKGCGPLLPLFTGVPSR
jgi:hypothetical protein